MKIKQKSSGFNLRFCLGVLLGYCIASTIRRICLSRPWRPNPLGQINPSHDLDGKDGYLQRFLGFLKPLRDHQNDDRQLVLVGIMTADKYINTRAKAIHETWAKSVRGKVLFFVGAGSNYTGELPVIKLDGVPVEDYPPQKKAFKMFQFMYDHHRYDYEWFFRADDDVYIKGDKIESLLRSVNSSLPWYIGQSGEGLRDELGKLGLLEDMPYCMGGPGVMLSHAALDRLGPHISSCMQSVTTKHEDTEVGRCIQKSVGIGCTSAYEMRKLLYQNYREKNGSFTHELGEEEKMAFTLHPVKSVPYVYRLHNFINSENILSLNRKVDKLQKEIHLMEKLIKNAGKAVDTKGAWEILNDDKDVTNGGVIPGTNASDLKYVREYFNPGVYITHRSVHLYRKPDGRADEATVSMVSEQLTTRLRETFPQSYVKLEKRLASYIKVSALEGVDMDVTVRVSYVSKFSRKGRHFMAPIKMKQSFNQVEFHEGKDVFRPFTSHSEGNQPIRMLVSLSGKFEVLKRFLTRHVPLMSNANITGTLVIILFGDDQGDYHKSIAVIKNFQNSYPTFDLRFIFRKSENYSRSKAITYGAGLFRNSSLLLIMDVDMLFTPGFLMRTQQNTIQGKQVYFPVYFSQYDPKFICFQETNCTVTDFDLGSTAGKWRSYGYGMVGVYKSDFLAVGGFNTSISGWGKEDVEFYEKILKNELSAFRSADPGLVHIYHAKICDSSLAPDQLFMCRNSRADLWASSRTLTRLLNVTAFVTDEGEDYSLEDY